MTQLRAAIQSPQRPTLRQRLLRGGVFAVLGKGGNAALGLLLTALLARLLAPAEFGVYVLAFSVVVFAAEAGQLGMGRAVVRFIGQSLARDDGRRARAAVKIAMLLGLVGAVLAGAAVFLLLGWGGERLFGMVGLAATAGTIGLWTAAMGLMRLQAEVFRGFGAIGLAGAFGGVIHRIVVIGALVALVWGTGMEANLSRVLLLEVGAVAASFLIGMLILPLTLRGAAPPNQAKTPRKASGLTIRESMRIGLPLMLCTVLALTITHIDMWMTGAFCSAEDLAVYGVARRLMLLVGMLLLIVNAVIPPMISELYERGEMDRLQQVLRGTATAAGLPAMVMLGLIVLAGPWLLGTIYGPFYRQGAGVLTLLCLGQMIFLWGGSPGFALMMTGHQKDVVMGHGIALVYAIGVGLVLIPRYGIMGTAFVAASTLVLSKFLLVALVRTRLNIRTDMAWSIRDLRSLYHYWTGESGRTEISPATTKT